MSIVHYFTSILGTGSPGSQTRGSVVLYDTESPNVTEQNYDDL